MIDYVIVHDANEEYYVVGDCHGNDKQIILNYNIYKHCREQNKNNKLKLIFLGDYLDRGKNELEVINAIKTIQSSSKYAKDIFFLFGNHEIFKYEHTITKNDPTIDFTSRLEFYKEHGIKLYYAYINVTRKIIISHSGLNVLSYDTESLHHYCRYMISCLNHIKNFTLYVDPNKQLDEVSDTIHHNLFYPFSQSWKDDIKIKVKDVKAENFIQICGHYHELCAVTINGNILRLPHVINTRIQHVKFILIDSSDSQEIATYMTLDKLYNSTFIILNNKLVPGTCSKLEL